MASVPAGMERLCFVPCPTCVPRGLSHHMLLAPTMSSIALCHICINYGDKNSLLIHILANAEIELYAYASDNPVILTCKP